MNTNLFAYIKASPTPFHAVAQTASRLDEAGYTALQESGDWMLEAGHGYYVTRNASSLIAFRIPKKDFYGFMLTASHCDSPCFKLKENAELIGEHYVQLSAERYGGMLCAPWFDRLLSVAGRVMVRTERGTAMRLVDLEEPAVLIPNVAIHMNRKANDGMAYNAAVDLLPLCCTDRDAKPVREQIAEKLGVSADEILAEDLFIYNPQNGVEWNGMVSAPRLDDLQCAFSALSAFLAAGPTDTLPMYCLFDNEEVGSETKQGAASTFLPDTVARIAEYLSLSPAALRRHIANSFLVSCDNAHAVHPNHPEYQDKNHAVYMNRGVVIKYNANQKYTTDAVSSAVFRLICEKAGVPVQLYANRADLAGGSTLGNIANTQLSLNTVDIGLAQLAMHSCFETAGAKDTGYMIRALTEFYETSLIMEDDGTYTLK